VLVMSAASMLLAMAAESLMAPLSNTPIGWSPALNGWIFTPWGSRITLLSECDRHSPRPVPAATGRRDGQQSSASL
jgi:hypothetical protein